MQRSNKERTRTHGEKKTYKYLGILKVDTINQAEIKEKITRRVHQTNEETSPEPSSAVGTSSRG